MGGALKARLESLLLTPHLPGDTLPNYLYYKVSRSSYNFAHERDANITRYCRLTFPAFESFGISVLGRS